MDSNSTLSAVLFRHPVAPLDEEGGWMPPPKEDADAKSNAGSEKLKIYSLEEIAKHDKKVNGLGSIR